MKNLKNKLNPNWVTGFTDAEGCLYIYIDKRKNRKSGWHIQPCFQIGLHSRDIGLLIQIKSFFKDVGIIRKNRISVSYKVRNLNDILKVIIPHFNKYPLITQKQSDFIIWKNIVNLISKGEYLNKEGLTQIIKLKASLNNGLPDKLKILLPNIIKVEKPKINLPIHIDYNWITGFFSGEGCFFYTYL